MTVRRGRTLEANVSRILRAIGDVLPTQSTAPTLILTVGLPGSGKSSFSRRLAQEIDAVVLESDALRRLLFGEPVYSVLESRRLFAAVHAAARELLEHGRTVIIDATSLKEADRSPVYELADEAGARLLILHFLAPEAVIERRLAHRLDGHDPDDISSAGLAVYRMMAEQQEPLTRRHWQIDTSDAAATESAFQSVVRACRQGTAGELRMGGKAP